MRNFYSVTNRISEAERSLASAAVRMVASDLALSPVPEIFFFAEDPRGPIRSREGQDTLGYSPPGGGSIGIQAGLSPSTLFQTIAHELRHAWQWERHEWRERGNHLRERDAGIYELSWPMLPSRLTHREVELLIHHSLTDALKGRIVFWRPMEARSLTTPGPRIILTNCDF